MAAEADAFLKKDTGLDGVADVLLRPLAAT